MKGTVNKVLTVVIVVLVGFVGWLLLSRAGAVPPPPGASAVSQVTSGGKTRKPNPKNKNAYLSTDDPSLKKETIGPRKWKIVDIHEHVKGEEEAQKLLKSMDELGVQRVALMASTTYTLTLDGKYGFEGFKENGEALIAIKKKWPDRFSAFVTFDPCDGTDNVAYVKDAVSRGADGVKLYLGHGASAPKFTFHCMPLNDPTMEPFWAYAEETQLPLLVHVNLEKYWDEILDVLEKHPYLRITLPHFGLHKNTGPRLARLGFLLERYPYVYTDISFGFYTFQIDGFEALGKFRTRSRDFLKKHRDKVLYASDMVLEPAKDQAYIDDTLRSYMQFLEMEKWRFFLVPDFTMHGMGLDDETLRHIYEVAPKNFLLLDDKGLGPDRTVNPKVEVARPPVPPLTPDMIPQLPSRGRRATPAAQPHDDADDPGEAGCEHEDGPVE